MGVFLRKYNTLLVTGTTAIKIPLIKRGVVDFAASGDYTPAIGDVKVWVDGTAANITNLPTAINSGNCTHWEFILTAAELSCKQLVVTITDSATKAVEDQHFIIETFGNASAMYQADLSAANLPADAKAINGIATSSVTTVNAVVGSGVSPQQDASGYAKLSSGTGTGQLNFTSGVVQADSAKIGGQTASASGTITFPNATLASTTNITAGTITTATNLTNLPAMPTDWLTSTGLAASAVTEIWASVTDSSGVTTLLSRLSSTRAGYLDNLSAGAVAQASTFTGMTSLAQWLGAMAGKQTPNSTALTEIKATGAGSGTFDATTDSHEALRDRGDSAWTTATGFSTLDASGVRAAVGLASANLDTQISGVPAAVMGSTIETGKTLTQCIRAIAAFAAGKRSNCGTTSEQYDAIGNAGTARIVGNADSDGNGTPTLTL